MRGDKEIVGTLKGFDDYVNMVLEDVTEYEITAEGKCVTKLDQILLNGNNVALVSAAILMLFHPLPSERHAEVTVDCPSPLLQLIPGGSPE